MMLTSVPLTIRPALLGLSAIFGHSALRGAAAVTVAGSRHASAALAMPQISAAMRADGLAAFDAAVAAVRPDKLVADAVAVVGSCDEATLHLPGSDPSSIAIPRGVRLLAFGKASIPMARAAEKKLGPALSKGVVVAQPSPDSTPESCRDLKSQVHVGSAGNLPDAAAVVGASRALVLAEEAQDGEVLLILISGGGSALLPLPADPLTLEDKLVATRAMVAAGASITQLNTVRKHLSAIKGGQLAAAAHPARVIALVLSDVVGDPLDVIASGPTVADTSSFVDALATIEALGVTSLPPRVLKRLQDGARGESGVLETPKPDDARLAGSRALVVGNNALAAQVALRCLEQLGYVSRIETLSLQGPVEEAAALIVALARGELSAAAQGPQATPAGEEGSKVAHRCVILGGETTVRLSGGAGAAGKGGRCSHMALLVARALSGVPGWCLVSLGTDGQDGPTDAAGACVDGTSWQRGLAQKLDPEDCLRRFDSYSFFDKEGGLVRCGLTGTNVMDLHILLCRAESVPS